MYCSSTVSYTHLDVYKRQGVEEALEKFSTVYNLLQGNYYQEFSDAEMIEKMTVGLVGQMGSPYTFYLTQMCIRDR